MLLTSFSAKGYDKYGHRLLSGIRHFMPGTALSVYSENVRQMPPLHRFALLYPLDRVPTFARFHARHKDSLLYSGREVGPTWKQADRDKGYCFRYDALKFCRKVFAIADASRLINHGSLTWIDADVYNIASPPVGFFEHLTEMDVAYLGRTSAHSECGFIHFKLPAAMPLIGAWENFYASDRFINEREYHNSYLFDLARAEVPSVRCESISRPGSRGHVWVDSPLGRYFDHTKGDRKVLGFSPERRARGP